MLNSNRCLYYSVKRCVRKKKLRQALTWLLNTLNPNPKYLNIQSKPRQSICLAYMEYMELSRGRRHVPTQHVHNHRGSKRIRLCCSICKTSTKSLPLPNLFVALASCNPAEGHIMMISPPSRFVPVSLLRKSTHS